MSKNGKNKYSIYTIFKTAMIVLAFIAVLWFVIAFMVNPLAMVFKKAFYANGTFSWDNIVKVLSSESIKQTIWNTLFMSVLTVISVNIIGIFQVLVTEYFDIKGANFLKYMYFVPLILTSISLVTSLQFFFDEYSVVNTFIASIIPGFNTNWFNGFWAVLYIHSFYFTSYFILFVRTNFTKIDYSTIEAAKSLGASPFKAFMKVALPVMLPSVLSASVLTFITSLASNAVPTMVGGEFQMLNSRISLLSGFGKRDMAAILALILGVISIVFMLISNWIEKKGNYISTSKVTTKIRKVKIKNPVLNAIVYILSYLMAFLYLIPIVSVTLYSFADADTILTKAFPTNLSFDNYIRVFTSKAGAFTPMLNSFKLGGIGTIIALLVGVISAIMIFKIKGKISRKIMRALELLLLIPWIIPTSMMGLGLLIGYDVPSVFTFGNTLIGTQWLLIVGYAVISIPTIVRLTRASLFNVNTSLEESAASLGSSPLRTFFVVVFPIIIPTIVSAGAQAFNSKLAEYTITSLLYAPKYTPLGIAFKNGSDRIDMYSYANNLVYIVVVMVLSALVYVITTKLREKKD